MSRNVMRRGPVIAVLDTTHRGFCRETVSDLRPTGSTGDDGAGAGRAMK